MSCAGEARNHRAKGLLAAPLHDEPATEEVDRYARGETYFEVKRTVSEQPRGRRKVQYTIRVSAHAELNLNGSYLVRLELDRDEIARLFYLTNGDRELPDLLETFSAFKRQEDTGFAAERGR